MTTKGKIEKEGMTKTLATFVHGLEYESLPETVRELAKGRILDALSSAYCGHNLKHSQTAIEIAKNKAGIAEDQQIEIVTLPKEGFTLSIPIMGFLTHSNELKQTLEQIEELEKLNEEGILYVMPYSVEVK